MTFQEKNISVTLASFTFILIYFLSRVVQLIQTDRLDNEHIVGLWTVVIICAIVVTIVAMIITHVVGTIIQVAQNPDEEPEIEDFVDERDKLIDLRGTKITYSISSFGGFIAMLTFALGQSPLIMFTLLIFFAISAQIVGDINRLYLYRRGF